jgi:hypothetical protein
VTSSDSPKRSILPSFLVGAMLVASTLALVPTAPVLLLLTAEGVASVGRHPENLAFVVLCGATLVVWPLALLVGWGLLVVGRRGLAVLVQVGAAVLVGCAGVVGVVAAAFSG